ncbi:sulfatase-like hydrolase/transferase, partial [bacterium]|nr:sulfatase-like hydrolase/transferase [bacterium]
MSQPNILIFMTDHQRADTVLPEHPAVMPHAARLGAEGVTFTQTFCPSPHCCPARATFMTGLYPTRSGVWNNICNDQALTRGLKPGVRVWGEHLAEAGYQMAWSGKWHVSIETTPKDYGWKELCVHGSKPQEHATAWEQYQQLATRPEPATRGEGEILRPGYPPFRLYGTRDESKPHGDERVVDL